MIEQGDCAMGRFAVDVDLANYADKVLAQTGMLDAAKVRQAQIRGIVDSGASYLVLPARVAKQLGLSPAGSARVRYADRRSATRKVVEGVVLTLLGRHAPFQAIVEPNREDALIGAIVLETLDLLVDCRTQTLQPRDPHHIVAELE